MLSLVTQFCPTPCDSKDFIPPGFFVHGNYPGKNTGVGCHALLHRIFSTQGSNPGPLRAGRFFFFAIWATREAQEHWSGWPLSILQGVFPTQESKPCLLHCRWTRYQLSYQEVQRSRVVLLKATVIFQMTVMMIKVTFYWQFFTLTAVIRDSIVPIGYMMKRTAFINLQHSDDLVKCISLGN